MNFQLACLNIGWDLQKRTLKLINVKDCGKSRLEHVRRIETGIAKAVIKFSVSICILVSRTAI